MTFHKLKYDEIIILLEEGKELCGYSRNPRYNGKELESTCSLNNRSCIKMDFSPDMKRCEIYVNFFRKRKEAFDKLKNGDNH